MPVYTHSTVLFSENIFCWRGEWGVLTLLGPQSRFGDKSLEIRLVCPQIGTAVLKVLSLKGSTASYAGTGTSSASGAALVTHTRCLNVIILVLLMLPRVDINSNMEDNTPPETKAQAEVLDDWAERKRRKVRLWKDLVEIFPTPPCSLSVPHLVWRTSARKRIPFQGEGYVILRVLQ